MGDADIANGGPAGGIQLGDFGAAEENAWAEGGAGYGGEGVSGEAQVVDVGDVRVEGWGGEGGVVRGWHGDVVVMRMCMCM